MEDSKALFVPVQLIERKIYWIRGQKVMLDTDLAELYEVETGQLKRAVRRNIERFPDDFMFQLTADEFENLRCQNGISSWGGIRFLPFAFTEQGLAMLSGVLNSKRAIHVNVQIMRAFVRLREMLASNADLARKLDAMEKKYDTQFKVVFDAIRKFMAPPVTKKEEIGFHAKETREEYRVRSVRTLHDRPASRGKKRNTKRIPDKPE